MSHPPSNANNFHQYQLAPPSTPYTTLPAAIVGGPSTPYGCQLIGITTGTDCNTPANVAKVKKFENGLAPDYYQFLLTGGTGQTGHVPDARIWYDGQGASSLPPAVYQLTNTTHSPFLPYDAYASSPVHRLFQMWQDTAADRAARRRRRRTRTTAVVLTSAATTLPLGVSRPSGTISRP